LDDVAF